MSTRDRADIRPGEDLYDAIDRLVDEDPIALRDLAWKLLAERDTNAIERNAARAEVDAIKVQIGKYLASAERIDPLTFLQRLGNQLDEVQA